MNREKRVSMGCKQVMRVPACVKVCCVHMQTLTLKCLSCSCTLVSLSARMCFHLVCGNHHCIQFLSLGSWQLLGAVGFPRDFSKLGTLFLGCAPLHVGFRNAEETHSWPVGFAARNTAPLPTTPGCGALLYKVELRGGVAPVPVEVGEHERAETPGSEPSSVKILVFLSATSHAFVR